MSPNLTLGLRFVVLERILHPGSVVLEREARGGVTEGRGPSHFGEDREKRRSAIKRYGGARATLRFRGNERGANASARTVRSGPVQPETRRASIYRYRYQITG